MKFNALIPELTVSDLPRSLQFYVECLGFSVCYRRAEEGFVFLERGEAQVMLCESLGPWSVGPLEAPYGRGVNYEVQVEAIEPLLMSLEKHGYPLHISVHDAWYRTGSGMKGQRQFLVCDPDGYLWRFHEALQSSPAGNAR
jgi:catechol 2,3-dioxygenase-like lactoylglutathione lyase family enzyme